MGTRISAFVVILHFLSSFSAEATSFLDQPFPDTIKDAPVIVRGKVGSSNVDFAQGADGGRQIFTFYEIQVEEVLRGDASTGSILVREMGGEKDGVGMQVSGTAHFERGEDVVVLLGNRNPDKSHDVRGLMMGKLNIERNQSGKEVLIGPAISHHSDIAGGQTGTPVEPEWTMEGLRELVKKQAAAPAITVTPQNPTASEIRKNIPPPVVNPVSPSQQAAPGLQPSKPQEPENPQGFGFLSWLSLALVLGIFAAWIFLRRRRR